MIGFAKIISLGAIIYLIKVFLYPYFKPISRKNKKRSRKYITRLKKEKQNERFIALRKELSIKYVGKIMSDLEKKRLKKMLDRLDMKILPEELRCMQIIYTLSAILISMLMFKVNSIIGYVSSMFIIIGWIYPVDEIEKKIEQKNKNIARDFPSFYSMVYYQYAKSVNLFLSDVIKDYLPNAQKDMADELEIMLDNIEYGETYALKQLKRRVPIHYIIKFCDIMETRLKGYDNVSQMLYLKNEIDEFRIRDLEEELTRREKSNEKLQFVLVVILFAYIIIYYLFSLLQSMKMFQ